MIDPGRLTPREWAESEARRRERREGLDNPHGREVPRATRVLLGWILVLAAAAMVAVTVLGLLGILPVFPAPAA